nr:hypothetical transcript [Hymenolepis microstoma]
MHQLQRRCSLIGQIQKYSQILFLPSVIREEREFSQTGLRQIYDPFSCVTNFVFSTVFLPFIHLIYQNQANCELSEPIYLLSAVQSFLPLKKN